MLGNASEEINKSDKLWDNTAFKALREQQDSDYGLSGLYEFSMPKAEGKWDEMTTNLFTVTASKVLGLLDSAWLQLFVDVDEDTRKKRKSIVKTEQFANGCIYIANRALTNIPSGKDIQSMLSAFACIMGGTVKSVLLTEDEKGNLFPDIKVYNPMQCQWEEDEEGISWFCYRNYVQESYFKKKYKGKELHTAPDTLGRVLTYTFWDEDKWKIACGGEYIDEEEHGLGYIPVNIKSVGSIPMIQSELYADQALKHSWQSVFANDRNLADPESRLLSIGLSIAREAGKIKAFGQWDSSIAGSNLSQELEKAGYTSSKDRNQFILLDKAKGEEFKGLVTPPSIDVIDRFRAIIRGMAIIGMIDPIAFGQMTRSGSGALAAELRSAALEFINPFKKRIEGDFIWIAEECVRQFKAGSFKRVSVEGRDAKKIKFHADLSYQDIEEVWFDCNLVPDRLRDEVQELGAAVQRVTYGLSSKRTAMLKHNLVEDPDKEMDIMDEELAKKNPVYIYTKLAEQFHKEKDDQMALYYQALASIEIKKAVDQAASMGLLPGSTPRPPVISPQAQTGAIAKEPETTFITEPATTITGHAEEITQ